MRCWPLGGDGKRDRFGNLYIDVQVSWDSTIPGVVEHCDDESDTTIMRRPESASTFSPDRQSRLSFVSDDLGSGLVEYAIIFVVFMTMLLGVADFGRLMYAYHFVSNAAREATRYAAVNGSTCAGDGSCTTPATTGNILTFVQKVPLGINASNVTCPTCASSATTWPVLANSPSICSTTANAPGCTVQVKVSYSFSFVVPFVGKAVNNGNSSYADEHIADGHLALTCQHALRSLRKIIFS